VTPTRRLVLLLTLVGLALRAFHMNAQSLWFDEILSVRIATTPLADLTHAVERGEVEPTAWISTAYYAVAKAVLWIPHGAPDLLLRATSVALGVATIPAFAWTATAFLPPPAALAATAALALSPFHVWYSQEVRPYALLVLLVVLAMGAVARALATDRPAWWTAVTILTALALYTHPIALALPVIAGAGILAEAMSRPGRARAGIAALAAAGLLFLPVVLWIGRHGANNSADARAVGGLDLAYAFYAYAVGFSLGPSTTELHAGTTAPLMPHLPLIAIAAAVFGVLLARGALATRRLALTPRVLVWTWLVIPLLLAFGVALGSTNPFNVRYAILSFPPLVLLFGLGVGCDRRRWVTGLAVVAAGLAGMSLVNLYFDPAYAKEDTRSLAAALAVETTSEDLVIVNAGYMASAVSYYYPGPARVVGYPSETARDAPVSREGVLALAAGHPHVWSISSRTFHGDRTGAIESALESRLTLQHERRFAGIVARRFVAR
jgi:4-amino-4-deoxy-L-arabinose transferase-like glycosyltransferase